MSKVYIINKGGHDFSPAERFGELVVLSEGAVDPFAITSIYRKFLEVLSESSKDDYILISGLSIMNSIASAIMASRHGIVNWLLYDAKMNKYERRTIKMEVPNEKS